MREELLQFHHNWQVSAERFIVDCPNWCIDELRAHEIWMAMLELLQNINIHLRSFYWSVFPSLQVIRLKNKTTIQKLTLCWKFMPAHFRQHSSELQVLHVVVIALLQGLSVIVLPGLGVRNQRSKHHEDFHELVPHRVDVAIGLRRVVDD